MLNLSPLFFTTLDDESCMHDELDLTPGRPAWIASALTSKMPVRSTFMRTPMAAQIAPAASRTNQ